VLFETLVRLSLHASARARSGGSGAARVSVTLAALVTLGTLGAQAAFAGCVGFDASGLGGPSEVPSALLADAGRAGIAEIAAGDAASPELEIGPLEPPPVFEVGPLEPPVFEVGAP